MCTVVLHTSTGGDLALTMNRDERWDREAELPPRHHRPAGGGQTWIGPIDGERGGTWIGINESGVAGCLLNAYQEADLELMGRRDIPTRGEIVGAALGRGSGEVFEWAESGLRPDRYPSFVLVLSTGFETRCVRWLVTRGLTLDQLAPGWQMVTSSLWRSAEVAAWRASAFDRWRAAGAPHRSALPEFNLLTDPTAPHHSPFMTRPLSATRSITQIVVERRQQRAVMRYWRRRGDSMIDPERPDATRELPLGCP